MLTEEQRQYIQQNYGVQPKQETQEISDDDVSQEIAKLRMKTQESKPKEKDGFFKKLGKEIVRPIGELGVSAINLGESVFDLARGDVSGASQSLKKERDMPFLGETKPAFTGEETAGEELKKIAGYGAEVGSWWVGGGGIKALAKETLKGFVKKGIVTGLKTGAEAGALSAGGRSLQEGDTLSSNILETAGGAVGGGLLGAVVGGATPLVSKGVQKLFQPIENKVSNVLREAIDKGIKPSSKTTIDKMENYYSKAADAFRVIKKYSPEIVTDEGEAVARSPQTQKEMLEALGKAKSMIYTSYNTAAKEAGEAGAQYNPGTITQKLNEVMSSKKYNPEIRKYASSLIDEVSELKGEAPEVIESRIQDLNSSLNGFYEGRVSKAKAQIDASVADLMRKDLDDLIEKTTDVKYQSLKNEYGSLKTIEKDLTRQVIKEARKNPQGMIDLPNIFTGADLIVGAMTSNPAQFAKGMAGQGIKWYMKYLNNPNRYIKKAFDVLEEQTKVPAGSNIMSRANETIKNSPLGKVGLSIEDVSGEKSSLPKTSPTVGQTVKSIEAPLIQEAKKGEYLYHGTNETVLDNITKEGLKPGRRGELSLSKDESYAKSFAKEGVTPQGKTKPILFRVKKDLLEGKTTLKRTDGKTRPMSDQLNEVLTKETIPPESIEIYKDGKWQSLVENPLIAEAKKYKSAEEFVKAQPTVYHGTTKKFDTFDVEIGGQDGMPIGSLGTFFTDQKFNAKNVVAKKTRSDIKPIVKEVVLDFRKPKIYEEKGFKSGFTQLIDDIEKNGKMWKEYDTPSGYKEIPNNEPAKKFRQQLLDEGYDGIIIKGGNPADGIPDNQWVALKNDVIKTKSQLIDIWNKANKGLPIKKTNPTVGKTVKSIEDPLIQEAKGKSLEEFVKAQEIPKTAKVWIKSKFSDEGAYADVPIIRKVDNITLYQGSKVGDKRQFWTSDKKYAAQFGDVKEKTGSFYMIDNGNRVTNVYVEATSKSQLIDIFNKAHGLKP